MSDRVWELLIDWDGTARSHYHSQGLFRTKERAQQYFFKLSREQRILGGYEIKERLVF